MKKSAAVFYTSPVISALIMTALLFTDASNAEAIFKSTDAQGEVSFSDQPPLNAASVEQVEVEPGPSSAEHQESLERVKRMESQADEMGAARQKHTQQPAPKVPQSSEEQPVGTHTYSDYDDEQTRRRGIVKKRIEGGAGHLAPARGAPHAGGGGRSR